MVKVLKAWENNDKTYMESFYSLAGNSILHWRTQYKGAEQEINELCNTKAQIRELRDFLNTILEDD